MIARFSPIKCLVIAKMKMSVESFLASICEVWLRAQKGASRVYFRRVQAEPLVRPELSGHIITIAARTLKALVDDHGMGVP